MALRSFEPLAMSVPHEPRSPTQGPCAMLAPEHPSSRRLKNKDFSNSHAGNEPIEPSRPVG